MKHSDLPREIELKLRLPPGSRTILESHSLFADTSALQVHQVTTYYDTSDRALDRAGFTLRVRKIGAARIQTVKSRPNDQGVATDRSGMGKTLLALAPSMLDRVHRTARSRARHQGRLSGKDLHDLRKSLKKLSFDVESLSGLFPHHRAKKYCSLCEKTLKILGVINDAVVTQRLTRGLLSDSRSDLTASTAAVVSWSKHQDRGARGGLGARSVLSKLNPHSGPGSGWERTASTRDGVAFQIRPIRADDEKRDRDFIIRLSPESRYRRMMNAMLEPSSAVPAGVGVVEATGENRSILQTQYTSYCRLQHYSAGRLVALNRASPWGLF